jgi:predicted nuclease of restriction endonuclease-like (RecB) superfamily
MSKQIVAKKKLYQSVSALIKQAQQQVVRNINTTMIVTYFHIGRMIVEEEQKGQSRATYAKETITNLSNHLTQEFGKGYSTSNLEYFRKFFMLYNERISQSVIGKSQRTKKSQSVIGESDFPFKLSWTHYIQLLRIEDEKERSFYEIEAVQNNWSVRELTRQFNTALYERVALSKDKRTIKTLAKKGQLIEKTTDALKSHYILEFLELNEDKQYSENELETAIINKLEHFMLELGKGFLFEGRQRRFTFEGDSFFVDLVFYNRLLKCFVLFDLKIGKLTHQDIGQMQMYVNYYDRKVKAPDENSTIGIILCKEENKTVVEFTLPEDNNTIFAREYKGVLPSKTELKKQIG